MNLNYSLQVKPSPSKEAYDRSVRRKSEEIREKYGSAEILHAAMMVQKELGNVNAHKIHRKIIRDPGICDQLLDLLTKPAPPPVQKLSRVEALAHVIHHDMSENDYNQTKKK